MKLFSLISTVFILSVLMLINSCEETDTTPPTVTITSPQNGSTVYEIVSITCMSSDNVGVKKVELWVNGVSTGIEDISEPYSLEWNTIQLQDGNYTIIIRSYDESENTFDSAPLLLSVDNSQSLPTPVTILPVEINDNSFIVSWTKCVDSDFKSYTLYESESADMSSMVNIFVSTDVEDLQHEILNIPPRDHRYYQVQVEDIYGLKSESEVVKGSLGLIVYTSYSNGESEEIFTMGVSGNNPTNISNWVSIDYNPIWFPDGETLLFQRYDLNGSLGLYTMRVDGSNQIRLSSETENASEPHLSHDASRIVYDSDSDGSHEIYILDIDGNNKIKLTDSEIRKSSPQFSPDMTKIVYIEDHSDENFRDLYIMDIDGDNKQRLTNSIGYCLRFRFSPNGDNLFYLNDSLDTRCIYSMNIGDLSVSRLTDPIRNIFSFELSPDGTQVVYISRVTFYDMDMWILNVDGSGDIQLMNNSSRNYTPSFSPDGSTMVFSSDMNGDNAQIYSIQTDGTGLTRLTNNDRKDYGPRYQPN